MGLRGRRVNKGAVWPRIEDGGELKGGGKGLTDSRANIIDLFDLEMSDYCLLSD